MLRDFLKLIYPTLCIACGRTLGQAEQSVCIACFGKMAFCPYTPEQVHPVEKIFWGRCRIEAAQSLLLFNKHGVAQKMLHRLKYEGEREIGEFLGGLLGKKLSSHPQVKMAELVIPLPLHEKKKRKRGYNQSEVIANGIAAAMQLPVCTDFLLRTGSAESQTRKSRIERVENVRTAFSLSAKTPQARHVLLVDDVITTGATLEACLKLLEPHFRVSVATLAYQ